MLRSLVFAVAVLIVAGAVQFAVAQPAGYSLTDSMMAQPGAYYSAPSTMARPGAYSPRLATAQPYSPGVGTVPRSTYLPSGAYGPNYGPTPARVAQAPAPVPTPAMHAPAPSAVAGGAYNGPMAAGNGEGSGCDGEMAYGCRRGWHGGHGIYDMPQHYPYYPPMHGYYYFHPYHYTHVPAQQAFASQFGADPRNPYSNDFFKVVYAEYKASLLRGAPEQIGAPPAESPADTIKKLKALNDESILSQEEFEAKKTEILQRM